MGKHIGALTVAFGTIALIAAFLQACGSAQSSGAEYPFEESVPVNYRADVVVVRLEDDTRCAVVKDGSYLRGVHCDWRDE